MSYERLPDGRWIVRFSKKSPKTKQSVTRRVYVKSEAEAKRKERELIAAVERKIAEIVVPKWDRVLNEYVQYCRERGLAEITVYNTRVNLEAATREKWGSLPVTDITTPMITELIRTDLKDHADSSKKAMLKYLRVVFNFAFETGYVSRNPTPKMTFRVGDKIKKVLTEEQARVLLNSAKVMDWPWYPHYAMALYTGMRNGELFALTWEKVDLDQRRIVVDRSWCKKGGFKSTKSGDDRIVEIAPNLLPILAALKLNCGESSFVLPHPWEWEKGEQARELRKFLMLIGLPEVRFHDLRASWATMMLAKGIAPVKVMMMGGWKDMKTMMIYMRKAGIDIKGITDCLNIHDPSYETGKVIDFMVR